MIHVIVKVHCTVRDETISTTPKIKIEFEGPQIDHDLYAYIQLHLKKTRLDGGALFFLDWIVIMLTYKVNQLNHSYLSELRGSNRVASLGTLEVFLKQSLKLAPPP